MKTTRPEYPQDRSVMIAQSLLSRPQGMGPRAWRSCVLAAGAGEANSPRQTYIAAAISRPGMMTRTVPCRPSHVISQAATTGPIAKPRFPPAEKNDIPNPRRSPDACVTAMEAIGWNAAVPSPVSTSTSRSIG